ncbi:N(G),N(G)-dimethylarginine dimethylaminohydrolase 1-like [Branchiostoma lanceolatum]|uniref:N(G),N(G)-dimethylarginine dimethylaminohydrolase 1-like n=1 Tax=Branchiostoma lanceolatum TaxID=7740 RepID=UPI003455B689
MADWWYGQYTTALVCRVPESAASQPTSTANNGSKGHVNVDQARGEWEKFTGALRRLGAGVLELSPEEECPQGPFVADCAVVCEGTALVTRPGGDRRKEVEVIKKVLDQDLKLDIVQMLDDNATLHGQDVLFTGKEFFVGLTWFTNQAGARALADAFPDYRVSSINVPNEVEHLGDLCGVAGPNLLAVGKSKAAKMVLKEMELMGEFDYEILSLPDDQATDCVYMNGTILHCTKDEFPDSYKVFEMVTDYHRVAVSNKELRKVGGALSRLALLIPLTKTK